MANGDYYNNQIKDIENQESDWTVKRLELLRQGKMDQVDYIDNVIMKRLSDKYMVNIQEMLDERKNIPRTEPKVTQIVEDKRFNPLHLDELLQEDIPESEWLVDRIIPKGGIVALSGMPGAYKTWILYHLALVTAHGQPFFGHFNTCKAKILIIDEENHRRLIQKRIRRMGADGADIHLLLQSGIKLDRYDDRKKLSDLIKNNGYEFLILDSLVRFHSKDENDASSMAKVTEALKEIAKTGATILFTHHHRKQSIFGSKNPGQSMRGSSEILAFVDCHMAIDKQEDYLLITQTKNRQEQEIKPFKIQIRDEGERTILEYLGEHDEATLKLQEAKECILAYLKENGETARQNLIEVFQGEIGQKSIGEAIKILKIEDGIIERTGEKNKKFYSINSANEVQEELL